MEERKINEGQSCSDNKVDESSLKIPTCRICYEPEKEDNLLIHPCRCTGSVRFVHEECLKTWLLSSNQDLINRACELCHTTLSMDYHVMAYISCKEICDENLGICIFTPILFAILCLIIVIIYFLAVKYDSESNNTNKVYAISLMVGCSVAGVIIILILFYILKVTLIKNRMENWKILNQDFAVEPIEKSEEHTLVTQGIEKNVLIIPGTFRICGKKIKSPKVAPLTLSPIFKDDKIIGYRSEYKEQAMSYQVKGLSRNSNNKAYHSLQDRQNLTL